MRYGAGPEGTGVQFRVWAPNVFKMAVRIVGGAVYPMACVGEDFEVMIGEARPGDRYWYVLDESKERPDPCSRSQPDGVHGPSEIIDPASFKWSDSSWKGIALNDYILYELHTGTFTRQGTFSGVSTKLSYLKELGVTAIEVMPVAQFPGDRNWGYDGVDLYAPHSAYGGPAGLKSLVNAAHGTGLAVVLDVVYNHLGPDGNYLAEFGPFFTDRYQAPWGQAVNFDGPGSDGVRRFVIDNALFWLTEYHIDALRLDAVHGMFDFSASHILAELRDRFHQEAARLDRQAFLIVESDLNDVRVIQPREEGGHAMDAQWHDEFHHAVVARLTSATRGYLAGFGNLEQIAKAIREGFVYDGIYSTYRKRRFGNSSKNEPGQQFVAFLQNHDQIANTAQGLRLSKRVPIEQCKLATMLLLCSPYLPLLFMGEEFADDAPFLYFTDHRDPALAKAVNEGRRREFADFAGSGIFEDPQSVEAFEKSRITWSLLDESAHREVLRFYQKLIALRKRSPCLHNCRKDLTRAETSEKAGWLRLERSDPSGSQAMLICNFSESPTHLRIEVDQSWSLAACTGAPPAPPRDGGTTIDGRAAALYLQISQQKQYQDNHDHQAECSARIVAPAAAIRPRRQPAD